MIGLLLLVVVVEVVGQATAQQVPCSAQTGYVGTCNSAPFNQWWSLAGVQWPMSPTASGYLPAFNPAAPAAPGTWDGLAAIDASNYAAQFPACNLSLVLAFSCFGAGPAATGTGTPLTARASECGASAWALARPPSREQCVEFAGCVGLNGAALCPLFPTAAELAANGGFGAPPVGVGAAGSGGSGGGGDGGGGGSGAGAAVAAVIVLLLLVGAVVGGVVYHRKTGNVPLSGFRDWLRSRRHGGSNVDGGRRVTSHVDSVMASQRYSSRPASFRQDSVDMRTGSVGRSGAAAQAPSSLRPHHPATPLPAAPAGGGAAPWMRREDPGAMRFQSFGRSQGAAALSPTTMSPAASPSPVRPPVPRRPMPAPPSRPMPTPPGGGRPPPPGGGHLPPPVPDRR